MNEELELLDTIRAKHRQWQKDLQGLTYETTSTFSRDVKRYYWALVLIQLIGLAALVFVWLPNLK